MEQAQLTRQGPRISSSNNTIDDVRLVQVGQLARRDERKNITTTRADGLLLLLRLYYTTSGGARISKQAGPAAGPIVVW